MPLKIAIATVTLGRAAAGHDLPTKLHAAANAGYDGVELTYECLADYHHCFHRAETHQERLRTARDVAVLAETLGLEIVSLQPFMNFDALRDCSARLQVGREWVELCAALRAKWLQVPSAVYPITLAEASIDPCVIANNMTALADYAATFSVGLAYEAPSWGVSLRSWQEIHQIIQLANRPNIKHCFDTFHIATLALFDPITLAPLKDGPTRLVRSLNKLQATVEPGQIAFIQLSDGCAVDLTQADSPPHLVDLSQPALCTWSRNARCHPYSSLGGHLPVSQVAKAFFDAGFVDGWVSLESFHSDLWRTDKDVPDKWAKEGIQAWERVKETCGLA